MKVEQRAAKIGQIRASGERRAMLVVTLIFWNFHDFIKEVLSSLAGNLILILIPIEQWLMFLIGQIVSIKFAGSACFAQKQVSNCSMENEQNRLGQQYNFWAML